MHLDFQLDFSKDLLVRKCFIPLAILFNSKSKKIRNFLAYAKFVQKKFDSTCIHVQASLHTVNFEGWGKNLELRFLES